MDERVWRPQAGFAHSVTEVDQLEALNATAGIAVSFAPPSRSVDLAFAGSQSETLSIWRTVSRTGFTTMPKLSARLVTLRFVDRGALVRIDRSGEDHIVGAGQALLTSFDVMRCEQAAPHFSAVSATVSCEGIVEACRTMFGVDSTFAPVFERTVDARSRPFRAVRTTALALRRTMAGTGSGVDFMAPLLQEVFLYQLLGCWPLHGTERPDGFAPSASDRTLARAVDFIEGNLARQIAVREVAAAAGIGVRNLQSLFRAQLGRGPIQYLLERRLDRVREELRSDARETVQAVARRWGFVHMSDFARRYRERHGHLPSDDVTPRARI